MFRITIYDNKTRKTVIEEGFNTSVPLVIIAKLQTIIKQLEGYKA